MVRQVINNILQQYVPYPRPSKNMVPNTEPVKLKPKYHFFSNTIIPQSQKNSYLGSMLVR